MHTNGKWSDGKPLTAADAAWTCNLEVKYAATITGNLAPFLSHVTRCDAPDPGTLVIHYEKPVSNVLRAARAVLGAAAARLGVAGRRERRRTSRTTTRVPTRRSSAAARSSSRSTTRRARRSCRSTPSYYGPKPKIKAFGVTLYQNSDAMIAALKAGDIDGVDEVPPTVVASLKSDPKFKVVVGPGEETRDLGFNSNPKKPKNRELLEPGGARRHRARDQPRADRQRRLPQLREACLQPAHLDLGAVPEHRSQARVVRPGARELDARQARLQARHRAASASPTGTGCRTRSSRRRRRRA